MATEIDDIERALVRLRRSQTRRSLAQATGAGRVEQAMGAVVDAVDEAGNTGVGGVARTMSVEASRASRLVAEAVQAGYVRRVASQADGRRSDLELTDAGSELLRSVAEGRRAVVAAALQGWSVGDRVVFADLLGRFVEDLAASMNQALEARLQELGHSEAGSAPDPDAPPT